MLRKECVANRGNMADERITRYNSFFEKGVKNLGLTEALKFCKEKYKFGEQTPFDASLFPDSPYNIVIQGEKLSSIIEETSLLNEINYIKKCIEDQKKIGGRVSLPFILTGKSGDKGIIILNKIFLDKEDFNKRAESGNVEDEAPVFDNLIENFQAFVENPEKDNRVVIVGYTNPREGGNDINCFVFEDFEVAVGFYKTYSKKNVKVLMMNVNSIGDFNVIGFENDSYMKYPNVFVDDNGKLVKLPSFTKGGYLNLKPDIEINAVSVDETLED